MLWIGHHPKKSGYLYLYKIALTHKQTFQGGTSVEEGKVISDDELKERFDNFSSVFKSDDAADKFIASARMLRLLSDYLSQRIDDFDVYPFTAVLQEFALIDNGNEPTFIKPEESKMGRPQNSTVQINTASIIAAIDILSDNGYSLSDAKSYVAKYLDIKVSQVKDMRSNFNRRPKLEEAKNLKHDVAKRVFPSQEAAKDFANSLLELAKISLK
jgi:hypothetical protein